MFSPRFAEENLVLVKTSGITSSKAFGENVEENKTIKDNAANLGGTGENVCAEMDENNKERKLDETGSQKREETEPTGKEEKIEISKPLNTDVELAAEEDYESRSGATNLTKEFFKNNLEDSDCRTFITTRGEVILIFL